MLVTWLVTITSNMRSCLDDAVTVRKHLRLASAKDTYATREVINPNERSLRINALNCHSEACFTIP